MTRRRQSGFTLIELIVAVAIFVGLALAAGTLYSIVIKEYVKDTLTQEVQRDGDAMLAHLSRNLKSATGLAAPSVCNAINEDALTVTVPDNQTRRYELVDDRLQYVSENGQAEALLAPTTAVENLSFFPTCDGTALVAVKVDTTLRRTKGQAGVSQPFSSTINARPQ